jgi:hypothetical protein
MLNPCSANINFSIIHNLGVMALAFNRNENMLNHKDNHKEKIQKKNTVEFKKL